jgi:hypothetical protein
MDDFTLPEGCGFVSKTNGGSKLVPVTEPARTEPDLPPGFHIVPPEQIATWMAEMKSKGCQEGAPLPGGGAERPQGVNDNAEAHIFIPIVPPPEVPSDRDFRHARYGAAVAVFPFYNAAGDLEGFVRRFSITKPDGAPGKAFRPLRYGHYKGRLGWHSKGWQGKGVAPLFLLPQLLAAQDAQVLVVEGEKAALAAARLFPDVSVTSPMNGAEAPAKTDWRPIKGRDVLIWPDRDVSGCGTLLGSGTLGY